MLINHYFYAHRSLFFTWCIAGDTWQASNEEILANTICVSNLHEDVTVLQLVDQFSMIGSVKVSTSKLKWLRLLKQQNCLIIMVFYLCV